MKSSNTTSWESKTIQMFSGRKVLGEEILVNNSTRELVEFYWSNRKRFSGGYTGYPVEVM